MNGLSNAGKYLTISNIKKNDQSQIEEAVNKVFKSYNKNDLHKYILIQEYIQIVVMWV